MPVQVSPELSAKSVCTLCRKILTGQGETEPAGTENNNKSAHLYNVSSIVIADAIIDYPCHDNRHYKLKNSFQKLEKRSENKFLLIIFEVFK